MKSFAIKVALLALLLPVSLGTGRAELPGKFGGHGNTRFSVQYAIGWLADERWHSPAEKTP